MSNYVIYARKSSESEERQALSIESQLQEMRSLARRHGVAVVDEFIETRSANAPGRPVFTQLMRQVRRGKVHGILAWKMDRLARNHLDTGTVLQALSDGRLERVITIDRTYTPNGNDRFIGNFELGMATKYIDDLRQNVNRGIRTKLQHGWLSGRPPLGYLNDPISRTIVNDPERFDLVRRIWDLMLTGTMRPDQILKVATHEWKLRTRRIGLRGGGPVARSAFYKLLRNPFYMGILPSRTGLTYPGAHTPMVTREEFNRVQELLGRDGRPRPQKHHGFAFTGFMKCASCGAAITAEQHIKKSGRTYTYYRCTHRKPGTSCHEPAVSSSELETQLLGYLARLSMPDAVHDWLLRKAKTSADQDRLTREQVRLTLERALRDAQREQNALVDLRLRELLSDEMFLSKREELESRISGIEEKLSRAHQSVDGIEKTLQTTFTFAAKARELFETGTTVQQRMILEAIGLNYTLRARKVALDFKKPFSVLAEAAGSGSWWACVDDVRTWLLSTTEYFAIPNFTEWPSDNSLPRSELSGKVGGRLPG